MEFFSGSTFTQKENILSAGEQEWKVNAFQKYLQQGRDFFNNEIAGSFFDRLGSDNSPYSTERFILPNTTREITPKTRYYTRTATRSGVTIEVRFFYSVEQVDQYFIRNQLSIIRDHLGFLGKQKISLNLYFSYEVRLPNSGGRLFDPSNPANFPPEFDNRNEIVRDGRGRLGFDNVPDPTPLFPARNIPFDQFMGQGVNLDIQPNVPVLINGEQTVNTRGDGQALLRIERAEAVEENNRGIGNALFQKNPRKVCSLADYQCSYATSYTAIAANLIRHTRKC